ncbi:UNVERIFIED_CONTAM: hypothetical protein NCL1_07736 [Trichonephila clavipes]
MKLQKRRSGDQYREHFSLFADKLLICSSTCSNYYLLYDWSSFFFSSRLKRKISGHSGSENISKKTNAQIRSYTRLTRKTTPGPKKGNASSCDQMSSPVTRGGRKGGSPFFLFRSIPSWTELFCNHNNLWEEIIEV